MDWTGFSDEDLRKLKASSSISTDTKATHQTNRVRPVDSRKTSQQRKPVKPITVVDNTQTELLPADQRLSLPERNEKLETSLSRIDSARHAAIEKEVTNSVDKFSPGNVTVGSRQFVRTAASGEAMADENVAKHESGQEPNFDLDEQSIITRELGNIDKFRNQQKMIEELNRQRKQLLMTAIQQRQYKAKAEATKLTKIKQELDHLDQLLSFDVSILRNRIEEASRDYHDAAKRYERAEREFVEAKIDLNQKSERKDMLTEHLYTVIHQNELRKAKKLAELMEKLEMEGGDDVDGVSLSSMLDAAAHQPAPLCLTTPLGRTVSHHGQPSPTSKHAASVTVSDGADRSKDEQKNTEIVENGSVVEQVRPETTLCSDSAAVENSRDEKAGTSS